MEVDLRCVQAIGIAPIAIIAILPSDRLATFAKNPGLNPQVAAMVGKVPPEVAVVSEDMVLEGEATGVVLPTDVEGLGVYTKWPKLSITVNVQVPKSKQSSTKNDIFPKFEVYPSDIFQSLKLGPNLGFGK